MQPFKITIMRLLKVIILIISFTSGVILSNTYRDYAYRNHLSDFGLADSGTNIFVVISLVQIFSVFNIRVSHNRVIDIIMIGSFYIIIEICNIYFDFIGTYDTKDIIAYLIGTVISVVLLFLTDKPEITAFKKDGFKA